ncbi:MAG: EAL domain-containing protein [Lachnospiraceae bacterium]|nr:EAL domain-containing protein [Lachnospiraceae bacterium]
MLLQEKKESEKNRNGSIIDSDIWLTVMQDGYDCVFAIDQSSRQCEFFHIGEWMGNVLGDVKTEYGDICKCISFTLIEEEQEAFIDQSHIETVLKEIEENGSYVRTVHVEGETGRIAKNIRIKRLPGESRLLCVCVDISTTLDHDWLTDEFARTGFLEQARHILKELPDDVSCSLVYTNIKGFKAVNELFGNQSGDMVIFQARDMLREWMKPLLLGRLESDHFVILVRDELLSVENMETLSHQTYKEGNKELHFDIRLGIYRITDKNVSISHMIDRAKLAENSIRDDQREMFAFYDDKVRENYVKQRVLLSDMSGALKVGEFEPFYQPVVDTMTGDIVSAEALVRWQHHDMGMVSPGDFIPIFENDGKISMIDHYMINRILDFTKERDKAEKKVVPCAVNLSRIDFYDPYLMEHLMKSFSERKDIPRFIRIEVTESAYADLEKNAMSYLYEMKNLGIQILLDDFGSGMSSLSTLESFMFDIVKLDMGFIRKVGVSKKAEAIIESTIKLSHALGAKVTAEGVETKEQLEFLRTNGCDYIQGYYFYKPVPEKEFAKILDSTDAAIISAAR